MTDSRESDSTEVRLVEGMILLLKDERKGLPLRYELWTVKSIRALKNGGATVKLLRGTRTLTAEGTARFPDGVIRDPWRLVALSQGDLAKVWAGRPES